MIHGPVIEDLHAAVRAARGLKPRERVLSVLALARLPCLSEGLSLEAF